MLLLFIPLAIVWLGVGVEREGKEGKVSGKFGCLDVGKVSGFEMKVCR